MCYTFLMRWIQRWHYTLVAKDPEHCFPDSLLFARVSGRFEAF